MTTPNEPTTIGTCSKCGAYHGGWEPCQPGEQWVNQLPQDALMTIITAYRDAYEEKHYPRGSAIPHEMGVEAAREALRSLLRRA